MNTGEQLMNFEKMGNEYFAEVNEYTYIIKKYKNNKFELTKEIPNKSDYKVFNANYCWGIIEVILNQNIKSLKDAKLLAANNVINNLCEKK